MHNLVLDNKHNQWNDPIHNLNLAIVFWAGANTLYGNRAHNRLGHALLSSRNKAKFDEWLKKILTLLKSANKAAIDELPSDFKYLKHWAEKLKIGESSEFALVEKEYMSAASAVGNASYADNLSYLERARRHGKGTKARIKELLRFVYYYSNYTHDCFIEAGRDNQARKALKLFWKSNGREIIDNVHMLDNFQVDSLLRLARQSRNVGVQIPNEWILTLEDRIQPTDPLILAQVKLQLENAEENLAQEETIVALVLADQALELFLRDLCTRLGCDDSTHSNKGDPFGHWGFTQYINFLSSNGEIDQYMRADFFRFHEWRNCAQHKGLEPSSRSVRMVIDEIKGFFDEHSY
jgi:hypothetical protein